MLFNKRSAFVFASVAAILIAAGNWSRLTVAGDRPTDGHDTLQYATFAGGCFWCMEPPFEKLDGVVEATSGYTGGFVDHPTYEQVSHTETGHLEAVRVAYDPSKIRYEDLLQVFWRNVDPTDSGGQFNDRGSSYKTAIFAHNPEHRKAALESKKQLAESGRFNEPIVTPIRDATTFYPAEDYHQDYYKKSTFKYKFYRYRSGRDEFLDRVWGADRYYKPKRPVTAASDVSATSSKNGVILVSNASGDTGEKDAKKYTKPAPEVIKQKLTPMQYRVTQEEGTEPPFKNDYWDNKKPGIYVDIVSGEPLFSSKDKYESGTGWPSFTRPLVAENVVTRTDYKLLFFPRTEVRSKHGDSHLGHVFKDGPAPTGLRYCLNSAALKFIPADKLEKEGYKEFAKQFDNGH